MFVPVHSEMYKLLSTHGYSQGTHRTDKEAKVHSVLIRQNHVEFGVDDSVTSSENFITLSVRNEMKMVKDGCFSPRMFC